MGEEVLLNLKWDNFSSHLALSFDSCYESQQFVDVSLVCKNGEVIKGHKVILANTSKFFRRLLIENDHPHPMIVLHNISADDLRSLMTFMYCGEVQVVQNDLKKLLEIADTLEVTGLQQVQDIGGTRNDEQNGEGDVETNDLQKQRPGSNSDFEIISQACDDKPASNLLKYVSSLGQRSLEYSVKNYENSSKKLQEMAKKFEESACNDSNSSTGNIMDLAATGSRLETSRTLEIVNCQSLNGTSVQDRMELRRDMGHAEGHSKKFDTAVILSEDEDKPLNPLRTETENEAANRLNNDEAQNCGVYIKDEVDMDYVSESEPDQLLEDQGDEVYDDDKAIILRDQNVTTRDEGPSSMLAAELLKAVASKRKAAVEHSSSEGPSLSVKSLREPISRNNIAMHREKKLAFHEPRPCEICHRVYRDAATLRQHMYTMHTTGPHYCGCGAYFFTKYELTVHKKRNHY